MSDQRLVLTCGYVSCLKTSLSLAIAPRLAIVVLATYGMGTFSASSPERLARDREVRSAIYSSSRTLISPAASLCGWTSHSQKRSWRRRDLGLARCHRIGEVAIVRLAIAGPAGWNRGSPSRRADPRTADAQADNLSAYYGSITPVREPPCTSRGCGGYGGELDADSCDRSLGPRFRPSRLGSEIGSQMLACGFLKSA